MCQYKVIAVTNRKLCEIDFLEQIEKIAKAGPMAVLLREKDLGPKEYEQLAFKVKSICENYKVDLIVHNFIDEAKAVGIKKIHMSMEMLRKSKRLNKLEEFLQIGVSVHSIEEAKEAVILGATYLIAGHIFETDCKRGLAPRGVSFLKEVCGSVNIPVYAIGGISEINIKEVIEAGAKGACIMSGLMKSENPKEFLQNFIN